MPNMFRDTQTAECSWAAQRSQVSRGEDRGPTCAGSLCVGHFTQPQMCKRSSCSLHSGVIRNELSHTERPPEAERRGISTPQRRARASTLRSAFTETSNGPVNWGGIPLSARRTVWVWFEMHLNLFSVKYYFPVAAYMSLLFFFFFFFVYLPIQMLCWNEDNSRGL